MWILSTNIKLMLNRAVIRLVMTYACLTWEYAGGAHHLKLQHLQNRVLCAIGNLDSGTPVHELHMGFKIPYACDYITILQDTGTYNPKPYKSKCTWYWTRRSQA
jgi:hypothetical protein